MNFTTATKENARLRLALIGPAGSGKTYTALKLATALGKRVALIDTEHSSASKYADEFRFDTVQLETFSPEMYVAGIEAAERGDYDVLIIDSLSHAWAGKDGALEMADREKIRSKSNNGFTAWQKVTPIWQGMIERILSSNLHIIGTMRSKTEYIVETNEKGKAVPRKVGLAPIIRDNSEYEFDIVGEMTPEHQLIVGKTRCRAIDGEVIEKPGASLAARLNLWLQGEEKGKREDVSAANGGRGGNVQQLPSRTSLTEEIEHLGTEIYHDMWGEQSEKIAQWASGRRTGKIAALQRAEKERVVAGLHEKMMKAA